MAATTTRVSSRLRGYRARGCAYAAGSVHTAPVIRLGTPRDYSAVAAVYRRASLFNAGDRDNLLAHPQYLILEPEALEQGRTLVAEEQGEIVGFASWAEAEGSVDLEDLFVDPTWMRRGIATALVLRILDILRPRAVTRLEVTANPHALGFYRAVGFRDIGTASTEFGTAPRMARVID
jgi:ribosomal protein S18 acetylase RimI-like enzyme